MVLIVLFEKDGGYLYVQKVYQPDIEPDYPAGSRVGPGRGERGSADTADGKTHTYA
jgi:hypothetical protein